MVHVDAPARAMQCPQCGAWCLLGQCDGFKVAVSAQPLTLDGYRAALLAGLVVYTLSSTRKLKMVRPGVSADAQKLLSHPCKAWTDVPLSEPQRRSQSFCKVRQGPGCAEVEGVASCGRCDPPPFDHAGGERLAHMLLTTMLGAKVIEVIHHR